MFRAINGMYAFALWDPDRRDLLLVHDRIRPRARPVRGRTAGMEE